MKRIYVGDLVKEAARQGTPVSRQALHRWAARATTLLADTAPDGWEPYRGGNAQRPYWDLKRDETLMHLWYVIRDEREEHLP